MRSKPQQKSLDWLKENGWTAEGVEKTIRIPGGRTFKRDLFGCIDIIAVKPGHKTLGIQACAGSRTANGDDTHRGGDLAAHREKAMAEPRLLVWLAAGNAFEIWSWAKQGPRGKRKVWTLKREELTGVQIVNESPETAGLSSQEQRGAA